jgi:hypothetical protein
MGPRKSNRVIEEKIERCYRFWKIGGGWIERGGNQEKEESDTCVAAQGTLVRSKTILLRYQER